jgi:hypothetical protein
LIPANRLVMWVLTTIPFIVILSQVSKKIYNEVILVKITMKFMMICC